MTIETGRRQRLLALTGLVMLCALMALAWAATHLVAITSRQDMVLLAAVALVAIANGCSVPLRIRTQQRVTFTPAAIVVLSVLLPPAWLILCTGAGVALVKALTRYPSGGRLHKAIHNTALQIVAAACAAAVVGFLGISPTLDIDTSLTQSWSELLLAMVAAAVVVAVIEELVTPVTVSLATGAPWRRVILRELDLRLAGRVLEFVLASLTIAVIMVETSLILTFPFAVLSVYLVYTHRLRLRAERQMWTTLTDATSSLNTLSDLGALLYSAVRSVTALFGASRVEVELWTAGWERLVRIEHGLLSEGLPDTRPDETAPFVSCAIESFTDGPIGILRVYLSGARDQLSDREQAALRSFAASLSRAVHNAILHADLALVAESHAQAARTDPLTGLANRVGLMRELEEAVRGSDSPGLLLLDLNGFKKINDTLGHTAGDHLLVGVANRLATASARVGGFAARLGGDEFAVVLPGRGNRHQVVAEQILFEVNGPLQVAGMQIDVRASGGVATALARTSVQALVDDADAAMYRAKASKVPVVVHTPPEDGGPPRRLDLASEIGAALAAKSFVLRFQPIVDLASGQVIGCEALARWEHPVHGLLAPEAWLNLVEQSDHLAAFTQYVLRKALDAQRTWTEAGLDLIVSVNISPRCLLDEGFARTVHALIQTRRADPGRVVLELSETVPVSGLEAVDRTVTALRAAGVRVALDDFGAGPSSTLSVVSRLPIDEIRIHRSQVARMGSSRAAAVVVGAAIELGRDLSLAVVAEGVATVEHRRVLAGLGCRYGQGTLFADPMPSRAVIDLLSDGRGVAEPLPEAEAPALVGEAAAAP
ncbi:putative bifunctional diguanylate cyclase/phosphodiesterase [Polymorphospora rubra]|uniref:putative bifunctional diguanylate cyclase/phosphodiesterase n=1 Tax=Polymorphospora rubra TaxID=338584 RepID=UPI0033F294E0